MTHNIKDYGAGTLPDQIRSRVCRGINGLDIHYLEAGFENKNNPLLLLLHGFPELSYSWRKMILPLSKSGYHVIAPDQRGFGATTGWNNSYVSDLSSYYQNNLVRDMLGLVSALGYEKVKSVIGHDSGAGVAGWSALIRPDIYESVVMMSAPFTGAPNIPLNTLKSLTTTKDPIVDIAAELANLERPRKHYQDYYRTPEANSDIMDSEKGLPDFIRAYYHHKSADWKENKPFPLSSWTAEQLAKMPTYYIMDLEDTMPEAVGKHMPTSEEINSCAWLTEEELKVYVSEYGRTGFQGGLNWYRSGGSSGNRGNLELFSGMKISKPAMFIAGRQDWGIFQRPGAINKMKNEVCTNMGEIQLVDNAGHWVQQEQPESVLKLLLDFLGEIG
ncbi:TPA: alpha/beta hydrolase [Candidatus Poribacteria bacterium]|nr:alpha/beta hydrolase [Candidatus Poribacteria bacterium]